MKTLRSKTFFMSIKFEDGKASGSMSGTSGKGSFNYKAEGADFTAVVEKFQGFLPDGELIEFYNDEPGAVAAGDGQSAGNTSIASQPPNCS